MDTSKAQEIIKGRRVLIVDDERDVLETLIELLIACKVDAASSFEEAKNLLETNYYDVVVLDIMGVNGYELLKIANSKNVPALMLTAHALSKEDLKKSAEARCRASGVRTDLGNDSNARASTGGASSSIASLLIKSLAALSLDEATGVIRYFSILLQLINIADAPASAICAISPPSF